jgi:hypothetical protein
MAGSYAARCTVFWCSHVSRGAVLDFPLRWERLPQLQSLMLWWAGRVEARFGSLAAGSSVSPTPVRRASGPYHADHHTEWCVPAWGMQKDRGTPRAPARGAPLGLMQTRGLQTVERVGLCCSLNFQSAFIEVCFANVQLHAFARPTELSVGFGKRWREHVSILILWPWGPPPSPARDCSPAFCRARPHPFPPPQPS